MKYKGCEIIKMPPVEADGFWPPKKYRVHFPEGRVSNAGETVAYASSIQDAKSKINSSRDHEINQS